MDKLTRSELPPGCGLETRQSEVATDQLPPRVSRYDAGMRFPRAQQSNRTRDSELRRPKEDATAGDHGFCGRWWSSSRAVVLW